MPVEIVTVPCRRDNYAYLVRDTASGTVALVDAPEAAPIERALSERGWSLDQIWITHHHDDHTAAVPALRAGARVIGNTEDRARLPELDTELAEGDSFAFGGTTVGIADVSGHTIGHIAFLIDGDGAEPGAAFTADSLMALGCGRVFEGTMPMMWASLSKLAALPDETRIYSGHNYGAANGRFALSVEPESAALQARVAAIAEADKAGRPIVPASLAEEKATNPFLRAGDPAVKAAMGMTSADPAEVFAELRARKDSF
ncbi:MAG: hydroxyacylglutathione hydrolase [Pseudomonadota bacterium]